MGRVAGLRGPLLFCLLVALLVPLLTLAAYAEEATTTSAPTDTSYEGVYQVAGSTSTGASFATTVIVTTVGEGDLQFKGRFKGIPVTTSGPATWDGPDKVSVPLSVYVWGVADGTGTVTLTRASTGWDLAAAGTGTVFGTSGSGTATGMGGGVAPTREESAEVMAVSTTVVTVDEAVTPVVTSGDEADLQTDEALTALAFILFYAFLIVFIDLLLGAPLAGGM